MKILLKTFLGIMLPLYVLFSSNVTIYGEETTSVQGEAKANSGEVVAVVNGQEITRTALGNFLIERFGEEALDIMIRRTLVYQEAKKLGIEFHSEELEERVQKVVDSEIERYIKGSGLSSEEELEKEIKKIGGTVKQLRERIAGRVRKEIEVQLLGEKIVSQTITITEEDLRDAYEEEYGEKIEACQIVVKSKKDGEEILKKIKTGADFETLARNESIDRNSAARGGRMLPFSPTGTIGQAVASLPKGGVSDLIKTDGGYHIVKIIDRKPKRDVKFEDVKLELEKLARERLVRQKAPSWLIALEESADIKKSLESTSQESGVKK
ncbi:MAG TPA: peptidylprolyl isomerase [Candidatus Brocadiia bacterium]|nr:peptidylprolyl isomerase [Candidatus Brocadiales bacterium]